MNLLRTLPFHDTTLHYFAAVAISSMLVCAAALLVTRAWRRASLPLRHSILVGALGVLAIGPGLMWFLSTSGLSVVRIPVEPKSLPVVTSAPAAEINLATTNGMSVPGEQFPENTLPLQSTIAEPHSVTAPVETATAEPWKWSDLGNVLIGVWVLGIAVGFGQLLLGLVRLRRFRRGLRPVDDSRVLRAAERAAQSLALDRSPKVLEASSISAPVSLGLFRPAIVVSRESVVGLSEDQLRGLMLHEVAHVARRDHWVGMLQRVATTIYWWNPVVWKVSRTVSALREQICDDLATRHEESTDGYAAMLVELAGRAIGMRPLPATIGMFDGSRTDFSRRVRRLLEEPRSTILALDRRMKFVCSGVVALFLLMTGGLSMRFQAVAAEPEQAGANAPAAEAKPAETKSDAPQPVKWPAVLRGKIKDEAGKPIAGAKVRLSLEKIHEYSIGRWDETLSSQEMVTGADGEYRFETAKYPALTHRPFCLMLSVNTKDYAEAKAWMWYSRRDTKVDEKRNDVTLVPGREVRGRVTNYDEPIAGAVVKAAADYDENTGRMFAWDKRKTDEDGYFTIMIPKESDSAVEIWVAARDYAPQRAVLPKQGNEMFDVRLQRGSKISGQVTDADGKPVAGTVVVAESINTGTLKAVSFGIELATKTDSAGKYQLPLLDGEYKIYLSQAEETDDRTPDTFIVGDVPPPLIAPVRVSAGGRQEKIVNLQAGPLLTVQGTVRWSDGTPVAGCQARASYLPPGFGSGIWIGTTVTDNQGKYKLTLPKPIEGISVHISGHYDAQRKWHFAYPAEEVEADQKNMQSIRFDKLESDKQKLDWILRSEDEAPLRPVVEKTAADLELDKLNRRYKARQQELQDAIAATTDWQQQADFNAKLDPRLLLVEDYLNFEKEHRGTTTALASLKKVDEFSRQMSETSSKLLAAREEMLDRLIAHYLPHEDLDIMFSTLVTGPYSSKCTEVLQRAIAESPHDSVRAAAIYNLALWRLQEIERYAYLKTLLDQPSVGFLPSSTQSTFSDEKIIERLKKQRAEMEPFDPAAKRKEAIELAKKFKLEYADVREPTRIFEESGRYWREKGESAKPSYGALADGLLLDLEHLQVGMTAPPIDGVDGQGKRIEMKDYQGKVTVVAFTLWHEQHEAQLEKFAKEHADEPFNLVLINCMPQNEVTGTSFQADSLKSQPLPVAVQWSIRQFPSIFVVDTKGVIRVRKAMDFPQSLVEQLLKEAQEKQ